MINSETKRLKKIEELEKQISDLKREQKEYESLADNQRLAELIHEVTCHYNHTDGCSWYYDSWKTPNVPHSDRFRHLKKANAVLALVNFEDAKKIILCLK
jgi:hypothetical protein